MYKIMIVEDDAAIAQVLVRQLDHWGYDARAVTDFERVMDYFAEFSPDLVLMDISLPFYNGYHWCAQIRQVSQAPVMFLSSAADNMSMVMALSMGADDYIAKPFDLDVATAKIQALLRRSYAFGAAANQLAHRNAVLNLGNATLTYQGRSVELSKNEFKILQLLLQQKGHTVSREEMMRALWQSESFIDDNTLTVNINRLRKRLEELGLSGWIVTKKGMGYLIEAQ